MGGPMSTHGGGFGEPPPPNPHRPRHLVDAVPWPHSPLTPPSPTDTTGSPIGGEGGDVSELLAACNAYVDNIVSENQRMRSKLLSCRSSLKGPRE